MSRTPEKDLFNKSTMSFGDHLEELRTCLFRSVIGIIIGFLVGLLFANQIVIFIQGPLTKALKEYYLNLEKEEIKAEYGENAVERLVLIEEQGLEVDTMRIDMDALAINLYESHADPGAFLAYKPYSFSYDDFLDGGAKRLFSRVISEEQGEGLKEQVTQEDQQVPQEDQQVPQEDQQVLQEDQQVLQEEDPGSPAVYLGSLLSKDDLQKAQELLDASSEELAQNRELRNASVKLLNGWVAIEALSSSIAFNRFIDDYVPRQNGVRLAEVRDDTETRRGDPGTIFNHRRLNRLLIREVFEDCLRPTQPQLLNVPLWRPIEIRVQTLNAHEAFMIWLKAAFICGFLFASPWVFYQVWVFVAAGLYSHEKKYVGVYLPLSLGLFLGGAALAFFFVFEPVLDFLFSFNRAMNIHPDPRISEWLGFVLFLPIGFGIAFQLPLVMLLLHRVGIMSVQTFLDKWRVAVLVICIVSMLLTPADPISMLLMAVPLVVLYFFGIVLAIWMPRIQNPYSEGYDPS